MTELPYENEFFDGILCNHVLQHGRISEIKKAISEMWRILRKGGVLFLTVVSTEHPKYLTGEEIELHTKVNTKATDGHIPHHFFTEEEIGRLFDAFFTLKLRHFRGQSELVSLLSLYIRRKKFLFFIL